MWEAIRSNQRRSWMLLSLMGVLLVILGAAIGMAVIGGFDVYEQNSYNQYGTSSRQIASSITPLAGGVIGAGAALVVWFIMMIAAVTSGSQILLASAGAREIEKADAPQLWNVVEEMSIASGIGGRMPRIFIIESDQPNAFACGRSPEKACVAVTSGLLARLDRDELQGVIAHEIAHVVNLDIRFMTYASVFLGSIIIISHAFLRGMFHSGRHGGMGRVGRGRGGGQGQAIALVIALVVAILAPIGAQLLFYACSRKREYLADASAARFTRYPAGLASALEKISKRVRFSDKTNKALAPLYIINPIKSRAASSPFATHPPIEKRVEILRAMSGAGFAAYEEAHKKVEGQSCLGTRTLAEADEATLRKATAKPEAKKDAISRASEAIEIIDRLANYLVIGCACGMKIKLPAASKRKEVNCPRCGKHHDVPTAQTEGTDALAIGAALGIATKAAAEGKRRAAPDKPKGMTYHRKTQGWESFRCSCDRTIQLSPTFMVPHVTCPACKQRIKIV